MQSGKILVKGLKALVTGSTNRIGNGITKHLLEKGSTVYSVDERVITANQKLSENHHFVQGNLADENFLKDYLKKVESVDALINCAALRRSYNYHLTYLVSKSVFELMKDNDINKFGCRGCIINLVNVSGEYNQKYFDDQFEFLTKYNINDNTIDDDVYKLADQLTASRIRCNTILVHSKADSKQLASLVTHIVEDQYIAGQVIHFEDDLRKEKVTIDDVRKSFHLSPEKIKVKEIPYIPPPKYDDHKQIESPIILSLPSNSTKA